MNNKMKGLLKGLRYISQIFDDEEEEKELQIGYPTNVKHVAHIGCDGPMNALSWMGQYKSTSASQNNEKFSDTPTKEISELSINPIDSSSSTEPLPESPAKRRHRRRSSASESPLGADSLGSRDKDSSNRGSRHSRRHHSAGATAESSNKEPSDGSSRRGRRHSKPSTTASESAARDIPSIPKQPRRRKTKEETSSAAPAVAVGIP